MLEKVLFVDDEPAILATFSRLLRFEALKREFPDLQEFKIETAPGGQRALAVIREHGPFAVIVSDLRMPGMDGVRFLEEAKQAAPLSVRMMLSGQADITTAIDAVNRGAIFRFLTKPCPRDVLVSAVTGALQQYRLVTAERQLLDQTLGGSVKILTEVLSLVNPSASSRALRVRRIVEHIVRRLRPADAWQLEIAAMLSQLGYLTLGVEAPEHGAEVSDEVRRKLQSHPAAACDLLANIPRLERVAEIVGAQQDPYDEQDATLPIRQRHSVKLGGQVLRVAIDFDAAVGEGLSAEDALARMRDRSGPYDPLILEALEDFETGSSTFISRLVSVNHLQSGMVLDEEVRSVNGLLLVKRGSEITLPLVIRLKNLVASGAIAPQIQVLAPRNAAAA